MPQVGLHCIRGDMLHQDCKGCALNPLHPCMLGPDLLEKLRERRSPNVVYSPTRLLGCQRRQVLERTTDYYTDVDDAYPLLRGNMVHAMAESLRYPGALAVIREQQLWTEVDTKYGKQRFESTPDLVVVRRQDNDILYCLVVDYKTKSEVGHDLTAALPEHVAQVNMYAWLVTKALSEAVFGGTYAVGVVVEELEIQYLGANKPRRFTSAGPLKTRGKMLTRKPRTYDTLELEAIPLLSLDMVQRGVVREIERRLAPREGLPAMLPEEAQWQCMFCPVRAACHKARDEEEQAA